MTNESFDLKFKKLNFKSFIIESFVFIIKNPNNHLDSALSSLNFIILIMIRFNLVDFVNQKSFLLHLFQLEINENFILNKK